MGDQPFYAPNRGTLPPRIPQPGELLFQFLHGHIRIRCELRVHGEFGVEAMFFRDEEFFKSRMFQARLDPTRTPRAMAIAWAGQERKAIEVRNAR